MNTLSLHGNALHGNVAIVTGASRGIGRSISLELARHGARVALAARTEAQLRAVQAEIEAHGGAAISIATDVTLEADIAALVRRTVERWGRLDIIVNNAGVGSFGPLIETTAEQWDHVMAVNARAPYLLCRDAIPYLRQQPRSFIVNITSVVGVKGYINQALYSASKHAVMGMSKALAKEVQKDGIRVHAICPGGVDTDLAGQARPDLDRSVLMKPEEVAEVVLFLVTRRGNAIIDQVDMRRESSTPWA
jgi:3-oxoacyl-[acyl-carrier protein] reductase